MLDGRKFTASTYFRSSKWVCDACHPTPALTVYWHPNLRQQFLFCTVHSFTHGVKLEETGFVLIEDLRRHDPEEFRIRLLLPAPTVEESMEMEQLRRDFQARELLT